MRSSPTPFKSECAAVHQLEKCPILDLTNNAVVMAESEGRSHIRRRLDTSRSQSTDKSSDKATKSESESDGSDVKVGEAMKSDRGEAGETDTCQMQAGSYWLTRIVFTRSIGFIYCKVLRDRNHSVPHTRPLPSLHIILRNIMQLY